VGRQKRSLKDNIGNFEQFSRITPKGLASIRLNNIEEFIIYSRIPAVC
jgi:hypothetical protein